MIGKKLNRKNIILIVVKKTPSTSCGCKRLSNMILSSFCYFHWIKIMVSDFYGPVRHRDHRFMGLMFYNFTMFILPSFSRESKERVNRNSEVSFGRVKVIYWVGIWCLLLFKAKRYFFIRVFVINDHYVREQKFQIKILRKNKYYRRLKMVCGFHIY